MFLMRTDWTTPSEAMLYLASMSKRVWVGVDWTLTEA